ncbi:hypothetical protein QBC44DRAFT_312610 [Cladorrhinum sp. PSN332]|nr:hypothetical protein QBC44DRAFT_312610 [Cladorrhinum sp. PSN332]
MSLPHPIQSLTTLKSGLTSDYPWTYPPLIASAPMRVMSGPAMAVAVSAAGGIGFIGPGLSPESTAIDLEETVSLLESQSEHRPRTKQGEDILLPVGVGFQLWNGDLSIASDAVGKYKPAAAWLFAPQNGQEDVELWIKELRRVSPGTKMWLQIGTIKEAVAATTCSDPECLPDVLVVQGFEAGGHGRTSDGAPLTTLLPEILSTLPKEIVTRIPVFAAGGISDGRGLAGCLCLGASGIAMGTRFLASREARIKKGYQDAVLQAKDGGTSTVKTHLYNHLRGTFGWNEGEWTPRTIVNRSWVEKEEGASFDVLKRRHEEGLKKGDGAWGREEGRTATYAGMGVGLVNEVKGAGEIVEGVREEGREVLKALAAGIQH